MKKKQVKVNAGMMQNQKVERMVENDGMSGFGIYMALQFILLERPENKCTLKQLRSIGKRMEMNQKQLCNVVYGYGLFHIEEQKNGETEITSLYLEEERNRRERKKQRRLSKKEEPHADAHVGAPAGVRSDASASVPGEKKEKKNNLMESSTKEIPYWEKYINQATEDTGWLEAIAMNNHLPVKEKLTKIMIIFKRHVKAQGREKNIDSVEEAKNYFANYARVGTPTYKRLIAELGQHGASTRSRGGTAKFPCGSRGGTAKFPCGKEEEDPYRYEDINPATGERSYCGIPIPPETPPRLNENAVLLNGQWTV